MPQLACPRCQRVNPGHAAYCHFDGTPLRLAPGQAAPGRLPHEFVFPSGRVCQSYDELVQACQDEWEQARSLLRQGVFTQYLTSIGRMDLAQAAQQAQAHEDPDAGLQLFLGRLPASKTEKPRLDLQPRRLVLGALKAGEEKQVRLTVANQGKGLLQGTLSVTAGSEWLRVGDGTNGEFPIKVSREQHVALLVHTRGLAARQNYVGKLTVITNGGVVEVPVSFEVVPAPFAQPPFQGATSPREMAEKMRSQPKAAVPLLESGEVARWFTANGWVYPVPATVPRGVAAVQQFFEGMGLSKPPPLELSETEARFLCLYPEVAQGQVTLRTSTRKWVYAAVESDAPWLKPRTPSVSGAQQAAIDFEVDSSLMTAGQIHEGHLLLTANGGQHLSLRVVVDVRKPHQPFTRRLLGPFWTGVLVFFIYRLLVAVPLDLYSRVLAVPAGQGATAGSVQTWLRSPMDEAGFVRRFVMATWWIGALGGTLLLWRRRGRMGDLLCGTIAGAGAGVLGSATFACLVPLLDGLARLAWSRLAEAAGQTGWASAAWLWTPVWIVTAAVCWAVLGGVIGVVLRIVGQRGVRLLGRLAAPLGWLGRLCGVEWAGLDKPVPG